jgi:ATP-binding cassette subfamily F protein uup
MRDSLDLDATLEDFISPGSEWVEINGQKKHVKSYLTDFLFSPARANSPVRTLSGGERNRLLLARLFARPANVLVLDEPTNDLDIDTLELLEELLQSYSGTVFLVSHDRRFLDNVVTSTIAYEPDPAFGGKPGLWREYEGGYEDWKLQRERTRQHLLATAAGQPLLAHAAPKATAAAAPPIASTDKSSATRAKLSFKEQRELDTLPERIAALEAEQASLTEQLQDPTLYADGPQRADAIGLRHTEIEAELMHGLERWEALSAR